MSRGLPTRPAGCWDRVRALVDGVVGVDPAGGDGVHPHLARQAHRQGVGQGGDAPFGRCVALSLGWLIRSREEEMFTMAAPGAKWGANSLVR